MKPSVLVSLGLIVTLLLSACAGAPTTEAPPTLAPSATPQPTVTPIPPSPTITSTATPRVTNIVIDGNSGDWGNYEALAYDPSGDAPQGSPDIEEVRAVINDQYVYLFIKLVDPAVTGKFDLGFETNSKPPDYFVTVWPREGRNVFAAGIGGSAEPNDAIATAQGDVVEVRFPRALVENKRISSFNIQIDLGGSVGDDMFEIRARALGEIEPTPLPGSQPKPEPSRVEFAAEDGHALVGYFYPSWKSNAPVVLLVHQYGLAQENWVKFGLVDWLQNWPPDGAAHGLFPAMPVDQSFAVFTLDLRGFGESGPAIPNNLSDEEFNQWGAGWVMDVKAAVEQVKSMPDVDANRIAIIGANNGADASVAACGDCLGVLALSAGSYAGLDTKTNAEKLDAEGKVVWCFSTEKSAGSDVATCSSLAGSQIKWINFPGDGRGMQLIRDDKAPEEIGQSILDFLAVVSSNVSAIAQKPADTSTSACFANETQLFASDFESGTNGWEFNPPSAWTVVADGGSKVLQGSGHVHANHPESWANVIWRLKVKIEKGRAHLNFHWDGDQRYLISFAANWTQAMKFPGGEMLKQVDLTHATGQWHVVEISLLNGRLKVSTNGVQEVDHAESAPLGAGGIWLEVLEDSVVQFDDIHICQP
ncbi:MAG: hypothetical protein HFACDABA_01760 [Anaerolineales bacterium]|nr:hypothetical protein [Anaerolineales bacterium]